MKVEIEIIDNAMRPFSLKIKVSTMLKIDKIAKKNKVSRNAIINSILEQAIESKGFILKIKK